MVLSGLAMIVAGGWLVTQAIGGNLAGRIRSWAGGQLSSSAPSSDARAQVDEYFDSVVSEIRD